MTLKLFPDLKASNHIQIPNIAIFTAFFIVGIVFSSLFSPVLKYFILFSILIFCYAGYFFGRKQAWELSKLFLYSAAVFVGIHCGIQGISPPPDQDLLNLLENSEVELSGVFNRGFSKSGKEGVSFLLEDVDLVSDGKTFRLPFLVRLKVSHPELYPEPGARYSASGKLRMEKHYLTLSCQEYGIVPNEILLPLSGSTREWIKDGFKSMLSPRHHALLSGFLIGDTSQLSRSDRELFRKTGITHLLAVSGQQVMSLAFLLAAILSWFNIPPLSRGLLISGFLFFFGLVTGGQPSVWRALIMYSAGFIVWNLESEPNPLVPISISAFVLLMFQPTLIFNLGFQLSFLAVLGIMFLREPIEKTLSKLGIPVLLARYIAVSTGANIATLPIAAWHFQYLSLSSFIINPLVVWLFSIILPMGLAVSIVGHFWFNVGLVISAALSLIVDSMMVLVEFISKLPFAIVTLPAFPPIVLVGIYALILFVIDFYASRKLPVLASSPAHSPVPTPPAVRSSAPLPLPRPLSVPNKSLRRRARFFDPALLELIEGRLGILPKRSLKSKGNFELLNFPIQKLSVEGQTLFHRLDDLSLEILGKEPKRIVQAQLFALSFFALEYSFDKAFPGFCKSFCTNSGEVKDREKRDRVLLICMAFEVFQGASAANSEKGINYYTAREIFQDGLELLMDQLCQKPDSTEENPKLITKHMEYRNKIFNKIREQFSE